MNQENSGNHSELTMEKSMLSLESNFISAVKTLFASQKIKIFNFQKINDINEIEKKLLPIIKQKIIDNELFFYSKVVNYDIEKLTIKKYVSHNDQEINLILNYFSSEFNIKVLFDGEVSNKDHATMISDFFENFQQQDFVIYEFDQGLKTLNQAQQWVKEFIEREKAKFKINTKSIKIESANLQVIMTDKKDRKFLNIGFQYNNVLGFLKIGLKDFITNNEVSQTLNKLFENTIIKLPNKVNYKNFNSGFLVNKWDSFIENEFKNKSVIIRGNILKISKNQIKFKLKNQNFDNTPWTRNLNLYVFFQPYEKSSVELNFKIIFEFTAPINYAEITESFQNQMSALILEIEDQKNSLTKSYFIGHLKNKIIRQFDSQIAIENKKYKIDIKNLIIKDFLVKYAKNGRDFVIEMEVFERLINQQTIKIECQAKNVEDWIKDYYHEQIAIYDFKITYDLQNKFNSSSLWKIIIDDFLKENFINNYFEQKIIDNIEWRDEKNNSLSGSRVNEEKIDVQKNKVIKKFNIFITKNEVLQNLQIEFQNLLITSQYKEILLLQKKVKGNYLTELKDTFPYWKIGELVKKEELGIEVVKLDDEIKCLFKIEIIGAVRGFVDAKIILIKNEESVRGDVHIEGFLNIEKLVTKVKEQVKSIDFDEHGLSTNDTLIKVEKIYYEQLEKYLGNMTKAFDKFSIYANAVGDVGKMVNTYVTNLGNREGDKFWFTMEVGGELTYLDWSIYNVQDYDVETFLRDFDKNQFLDDEHAFLIAKKTIGQRFEHVVRPAVYEENLRYGVLIDQYILEKFDSETGIANIKGNVEKIVTNYKDKVKHLGRKTFEFEIHNFWTFETMSKKLVKIENEYFDYPVHGLSNISSKNDISFACRKSLRFYLKESFDALEKIDYSIPNVYKGEAIRCTVDFYQAKEFPFYLNFKNIIEGDIVKLKNKIYEMLIKNHTTKKNFDPRQWKENQILTISDLGIKLPNDLLGCTLSDFEFKWFDIYSGSVLVNLKISKKSTFADFKFEVWGFKKP